MTPILLRLREFIYSDLGRIFIIAIAWQTVMSVVGFIIFDGGDMLSHMTRWDGGWYSVIIQDRYISNDASAAFYPLFPMLVELLHTITFGLFSLPLSALLINTVSLWLGLYALLQITVIFTGSRARYLAVILFLCAPAAFFCHLFYTEALFIAIAFWAYLFSLRKQWLLCCLLLAALTACRLPALLFIGLCGLEYIKSYRWNIKRALNKNMLLFSLTPIGFICYGLYLYIAKGDFLDMFHAYSATTDWAYQVFHPNFIETIARGAYQVLRAVAGLRPFDHDILVNHLIPILCIVTLFTSSLYCIFSIKKKGLPLGIFGLVSIAFFTINHNLVSVHRYALPCITVVITLVHIYMRFRKLRPFIIIGSAISLTIQCYLLYLYLATITFAG